MPLKKFAVLFPKSEVDFLKVLVVDGLTAIEEHFLRSKNVRIKFVTCGKADCRCRLGFRHGPYYYRRKKINGKYKDVYVKPPKETQSFTYEAVGSSVLLEIKKIENLPDFLKRLPAFVIKKRLS